MLDELPSIQIPQRGHASWWSPRWVNGLRESSCIAMPHPPFEHGPLAGGYGEVMAYHHPQSGMSFAVKLCLSNHPDDIRRFERERDLLVKCDHPNVVRGYGALHDWFAGQPIDVRVPAYAMELCRFDLEYALAAGDLCVAVDALPDVADMALAGLIAMRRKGMLVHRDVKPRNLLLGYDGMVKVADPGIHRAAVRDPHTSVPPDVGPFGCAEQMVVVGGEHDADLDPELLDDQDPTQVKGWSTIDVHAIGSTLFFLATRRHAYTKNNYRLNIARGARIRSFSDLLMLEGVNPQMATWIDRACSAAWQDRFETVEDATRGLAPIRDAIRRTVAEDQARDRRQAAEAQARELTQSERPKTPSDGTGPFRWRAHKERPDRWPARAQMVPIADTDPAARIWLRLLPLVLRRQQAPKHVTRQNERLEPQNPGKRTVTAEEFDEMVRDLHLEPDVNAGGTPAPRLTPPPA